MGRGVGQVVIALAFYSDEFESRWRLQFFSVKFVFEKNENKQ